MEKVLKFYLLLNLVCVACCIKVLDFSEDNDDKNNTNDAFPRAFLDIADVPPTFTICSAFLVNQYHCWWGCYSMLFNITWLDDGTSLHMKAIANRTYNHIELLIGNSTLSTGKISIFPQRWIHICARVTKILDLIQVIQVVVDGQPLNYGQPEMLLSMNEKSTLRVSPGYDYQNENAHIVRLSNINLFSKSISTKKLEELTTTGSSICGGQGDLLTWKDSIAKWKLFSVAKFLEIDEEEGPCRKDTFGLAVLRGLCHKGWRPKIVVFRT